MANINFSFGVQMDKQSVLEAQNEVKSLIKKLEREMKISDLDPIDVKQIKKSAGQLEKVFESLGDSYVESLEKFNVEGFLTDLKRMNISIDNLKNDLEDMGYEGYLSLEKFTQTMKETRIEIERTEGILEKTGTTLGKTFLWSMSNRAVDTFVESVRNAVDFVYDLDESLNNIRVVSEMSASQMRDFAVEANEAAKALGQTTVAYTEGALLYLQQGRTLEESRYLTEATLIGANVTGESTADVAELLTASLNGYNLAAKDAMDVTDKFAAVGAATGSDFYELATAFSKTASMASTVGVSFDKLTAQIATISTVTRETPETIGTSLKTIFARMSEISLGGSDGEYDFGAVKSQLDAVGISIVDNNNELREMGDVIEEIGDKWSTFNRNQQVAIANAMGGKLQANRLLALFNNWEMYQDAVETSTNAAGAAMEQNEIRMDSLEYKTNQLRASFEEFFMTIVDSDAFKVLLDGLISGTQTLTSFIDVLGSIIPALTIVGTTVATAFAPKMLYGTLDTFGKINDSIKDITKSGQVAKNLFENVFNEDALGDNKKFTDLILKDKNNTAIDSLSQSMIIPEEQINKIKEASQNYQNLEQDIHKLNRALEESKEKERALTEKIANEYDALKEKAQQLREESGQWFEFELTVDDESLREEAAQLSEELAAQAHAYELEAKAMTVDLEQQVEYQKNYAKQIEIARENQEKLAESTREVVQQSKYAYENSDKLAKVITGIASGIQLVGGLRSLSEGFAEVEGQGEKFKDSIVNISSSIATLIPGWGPLIAGGIQLIGSILPPFETALEKTYAKAAEYEEKLQTLKSNEASVEAIKVRIEEAQSIVGVNEKMAEEIEIANQLAELFPNLVSGYDLQGNAIVDLTVDLDDYIKKQREALETSEEFQAALETFFNKVLRGELTFQETEKSLMEYIVSPFLSADEAFKSLDTNIQNSIISMINFNDAIAAIQNGASFEEVQALLTGQINQMQGLDVVSSIEKIDSSAMSNAARETISILVETLNLSGVELAQFYSMIANSTEDLKDLTIQDIMEITSSFEAMSGKNPLDRWKENFTEGKVALEEFVFDTKLSFEDIVDAYSTIFAEEGSLDKQTLMNTFLEGADDPALVEEYVSVMKKNLVNAINNGDITSEEETLIMQLLGLTDAQLDTTTMKALEAKEKVEAAFMEQYENPLSFATRGEMDEAIDKYQELIDKNELLVQLFNEANDLEWKEGHPFSESFADIVDGNIESAEELGDKSQDLLLTLNEMFEDVKKEGGSLTEFFDADMANAIQSLIERTDLLDTPFESWPDSVKDTLAEVYNHFADFEDKTKGLYLALNSANTEFYQQLRTDNQETFAVWDENFGLAGKNFQNLAEYQVAVDLWKYEQLNALSNDNLERIYQAAIQEGLIEEAVANETLTLEDKKYLLSSQMSADAMKTIIDNKIAELEAEKKKLIGESEAEAEAYNESIRMNAATGEKISIQNDQLANNAREQVQSMITDLTLSGALEGVSLGNISTKGVGSVTIKAMDNIKSMAEARVNAIESEIAALESLKASIELYESYNPEGLDFTLESYNPTNTPTTTAGGYTPPKGSSSSKKDSSEKEVEDLEFKKDLYHDINIELQKTQNLLTKLQEVEDDLYGESKIENLKQQAELIRQQRNLTSQKLDIAKKERDDMKKSLSGMGVKFDDTGAVTNYNQLLEEKTNWANSLSGDAKEQAKEYVEALRDAIASYEELHFTTIIEYESELEELREAIQEKILEAIEYEYEFNIKASVDFQKEAKFLNEFLKGFESVEDGFKRTLEVFDSQIDALDAFEKRYNDILNNADLDAEVKREAIEQLQEDFQDALLDLQDFYEAISEYIQEVISQNTDLVYDQIAAFESINEELSDMIDMYELLGNKDYDAINNMLGTQVSSNQGQIELLTKAREEAIELRDSLEEGTEEWKAANEQVEKMDKDIRKLAEETVKLLQQQLENTFEKTLNQVEKALTGGLGFDKLEKEIEKVKDEQEKYYDSVEKSVWSARMLEKIQKDISKQTDPKKQQLLQKFYDEQVATLTQKDKLTADEVERAELLYELTLKQMAVEEARANKTVMRLVRNDQGNWVYQYMADLEAVATAQESLTSSIDDLMAHDKEVYEKTQDEILERRKQFIEDMQALQEAYLNGEFEDEAAFNQALQELQEQFNSDMLVLTEEYALAERNIAESTLMSICDAYGISFGELNDLSETQRETFKNMGIQLGNDWSSTLDNMTAMNLNYTSAFLNAYWASQGGLVSETGKAFGTIKDSANASLIEMQNSANSAFGSIKGTAQSEFGNISTIIKNSFTESTNAATEYKNNVETTLNSAGMSFDSMANKTESLKTSTNNLKNDTDKLVTTMGKEYDAIKKNLGEYDKIKQAYNNIKTAVDSYVTSLNKAIEAQKNLSNTKPNTSTSSNSSSSSSSSSTKTPQVGDVVKSVPGTWYYDSAGATPSGTPSKWASQFKITKHVAGAKKPWHIQGTNGGTGSGWVEWVGFKTGGYTGDWSKTGGIDGQGGKMAVLHQKELVLNASDTENMLKAVELVRELKTSLFSASGLNMNKPEETVNQNITIQADFSGVQSSSEIEKAFNNLINQAQQYANQRK